MDDPPVAGLPHEESFAGADRGGAEGAAQHNNHLIEVLFNQKEVSSSVPVEYQEFIQNYKIVFVRVDDEVISLQNIQGLPDTTLMKSILLASSLDNESNIGIEQYLLDKHYQRKHGKNAYYGQNK